MAARPRQGCAVDHASMVESIVPSAHKLGDPGASGLEIKKHLFDTVDKAEIRRAIRKMDLTILPVMTMFYLLSFLVNLFHYSVATVCSFYMVTRTVPTLVCRPLPNFGCFFLKSRNRRECKSRRAAEGFTYDRPPISNLYYCHLCVSPILLHLQELPHP